MLNGPDEKKAFKLLKKDIQSKDAFTWWIYKCETGATVRFGGYEWASDDLTEAFCRAYLSWKKRR